MIRRHNNKYTVVKREQGEIVGETKCIVHDCKHINRCRISISKCTPDCEKYEVKNAKKKK